MTRFILRSLLYSLVGSVVYAVVLYVTFPSDDLKARIMTEARKAGVDLRIGDVKPHSFGGVGLQFDGVSLAAMDKAKAPKRKRGKAAEDNAEEPPPEAAGPGKAPFLNFDDVVVDVAMLPLMRSAEDRVVELDIDAEAYGGEITGDVQLSKARRVIDVSGTGMQLARYPIAGEGFKIDALGMVSFDTDLDMSVEDYKASTGTVTLDVQGLRILKSSTVAGMPLPVEMLFTESVMRLAVAEGKANVEAMRLMGDAISVEGDGEIFLSADMTRSRLKLKVRIKPGADLQILTAVLPSRAKSDDGYYHYMVTGLITDPRFRPDAGAARRWEKDHGGGGAVSARGTRPAVNSPDDSMDDDYEEEEPDARRAVKTPQRPSASPINKDNIKPGSMSDDERDQRREERARQAEERRVRREERLKKIRESQEATGRSFQDRTRLAEPPFPGEGDAPFRPGMGPDDMHPPAAANEQEEEYFEEEPHFEQPIDGPEGDFGQPEVEILPEGDFEDPPAPGERFDELPIEGGFDEPLLEQEPLE